MPEYLTVFLLTLLLIAAVGALADFWRRWRTSEAEALATAEAFNTYKNNALEDRAKLFKTVEELSSRIARLAPYEGVANADERAKVLIHDAEVRAKEANERADAILSHARARGDVLISQAQSKALSIAGPEAIKALQDKQGLAGAIEAMKNAIEGYGDRYLIPSQTLVDDLADELAHTTAGKKLKQIRDEIRRTLREGRAGKCDSLYGHPALRFVVDAFNGKVDSVLAKVKHDNAGTLMQEIKDAFALVNLNAKTYLKGEISEAYLKLRLDELLWASVGLELKRQEREEQRKIKEQMRDEEQARREYERVIREASRDEEIVRRAMEKAQQQLAKASDEQKAKFEEQLQGLRLKLKEAEEKNQRAVSMAQQTKRGHVYIISNVGSFGQHVYKIGLTRRLEPLDRIKELGDSSVPFEFDVHALIFAEDAPKLEYELHQHFMMMQINKVNYRKEFFRVDLAHIREETQKLGLTANWTMTSSAAEYRESMKIEEMIAKDPQAREAWIRRQLTYEPVIETSEEDNNSREADTTTLTGAVSDEAG